MTVFNDLHLAQEIIEDLQELIDEQATEMAALKEQVTSIIQHLTLEDYRSIVQNYFVDYCSEIPLQYTKEEIRDRMNQHVPGMVYKGWAERVLPQETAMKIAYKVGFFDKAM